MSPRDVLGMKIYTIAEFDEAYPLENVHKNGSRPFGSDIQTMSSESGPNKSLPFFTVGALKERAASEEDSGGWIIPKIARKGDLTLFAGEAKKAGKTTFLLHALKAAHDGDYFLEEPTEKTASLVLTEQGGNILEATQKAKIADEDRITFVPFKDVSRDPWRRIIENAVHTCEENDFRLLVFDTFNAFARLRGSDENLVGEIAARMEPVLEAVRSHDLAVVLVHHTGKDGEIRGSSHFLADPDIIWTLKRPVGEHAPNVRTLTGLGRYDTVNVSLNVALEEGGYELRGSGQQIERGLARDTALAMIPFGRKNAVRQSWVVEDLAKKRRVASETTIKRAIRDLLEEAVVKDGTLEEAGNPRVLWRPEGLIRPDAKGTTQTPGPNKKKTPRKASKVVPIRPGISPNPTPRKAAPEITPEDLLAADEALAETYPNLIYRDEDLEGVRQWIRTLTEVSLDIETQGISKTLELYRKEALSFVKGKVRLIQLSGEGQRYLLDVELLDEDAVSSVLKELKGKVLYVHNAIFDLPRILRSFGVDLMGEEIRDTFVLSKLTRAGEWEPDPRTESGITPLRHNIKDALKREIGIEIPKDAPQRWDVPLTEAHLLYARDDVEHLPDLHSALVALADERELRPGLELLERVYPLYMRQQYRGIPFDKERFDELRRKIESKVDDALRRLEEHAPEHPEAEAEGKWSWRNKQRPDEENPSIGPGRNGALRALALSGVILPNLRKATRLEYLKEHPDSSASPLLEALHDYYSYSDLQSDCKSWLRYSYEDGRLYPNVKFASQETGRSAYADPPVQNIPKERDEELGVSLRDCIRAPEGMKIIKADYAAQELRILAYLAGDHDLIRSFMEGSDPHIVVGEHIAGEPLERGTPEGEMYRKLGKRANYGFSYGAGPKRYATSVYEDTSTRISEKQARVEQQAFQKAWPGVYRWQQSFGARNGREPDAWFTTSFVGRRRYVGERDGKPNYCDRLNGPVQSGGADMLYLALAKLAEDKESRHLDEEAEIIFTTHDEIVLETREGDETSLVRLVQRMREAEAELIGAQLAGEDCVEGTEGPSWGGK